MFKHYKPFVFFFLIVSLTVVAIISCKEKSEDEKKQTILEGEATVYVDASFQYLVEDQVAVFENQYKAKINLKNATESEIVNTMLTGKADIAVLSRRLTSQEEQYFKNKNITPKITHFASDAVVFITGKTTDTLLDLEEVVKLMQGKQSKISNLVFENPNSGTVSYMKRLAGISGNKNPNLYYLKSDKEVIAFVAKNPQSIGVIGLSPMVQPYPESKPFLDQIAIMSVKNVKNGKNTQAYYSPTQANLGKGLYPLKRSIYMLNYQPFSGLGMGFASFVAGDIGQRIVLKSQLLPVRIPEMNINIRTKIE